MNDCSRTLLGGDVKKHVPFQRGKICSHGRKHFNIQTFSALRAVGGDVEIFRTKFLGGDRDEKIDFRRITSRAP